jgi:hypothetical protein
VSGVLVVHVSVVSAVLIALVVSSNTTDLI